MITPSCAGRPACSDTTTIAVTRETSGCRLALSFRRIRSDDLVDQEREGAWPAYRNTDPTDARHRFLHRFGLTYWAIGATLDGLEMVFATGVTAGWQYGCPSEVPESEWRRVPLRPHGCCETIIVASGLEVRSTQLRHHFGPISRAISQLYLYSHVAIGGPPRGSLWLTS